jgi:accessory gene regulator B
MQNHWTDQDLYDYGIRQIKLSVLNVVTILLVGCFFDLVEEGIIFTVCYILLRKVSGGFHAGTWLSCYLFSVVFYICSLLTIKCLYPSFIIVVLGIVLFLILIRHMPVDNDNKKLNDSEKNIFRRVAIVVYVSLFLLDFLLLLIERKSFYVTISVAIIGAELLCVFRLMQSHVLSEEKKIESN